MFFELSTMVNYKYHESSPFGEDGFPETSSKSKLLVDVLSCEFSCSARIGTGRLEDMTVSCVPGKGIPIYHAIFNMITR